MMHQYIKGTMLRQDDIRLVKLLLIAVRLKHEIGLTPQQMHDWNNSSTEEHVWAYDNSE